MEIIQKCLIKLKEKDGNMYIYSALLMMCAMMMFAAVYEVMHIFAVVQGVRDATGQAVVAAATDNSYNAFVGLKEGNTYASAVTTDDVKSHLSKLLSLDNKDGTLEKNINGVWQYSIKSLSVEYTNADMAQDTNMVTLNFTTTLVLEISIRFGNDMLPPVQKQMTVKSSYTPMF